MWEGKRVLALLPARGGSKGLPGKNVRILQGIPLIAHSIQIALENSYIDTVLVSTDDPEIAAVSKQWGALVPFLRPQELAQDETPTAPVVRHAIEFMRDLGHDYEWVVLLQPTSPCRIQEDLNGAMHLLKNPPSPCTVVSVCATKQHPAWSYFLNSDNRLVPVLQEGGKRRQDLLPVYSLNGAIYIYHAPSLLNDSLTDLPLLHWVMPAERSIDIDTEFDFRCAEIALEMRKRS